VYGTQSRSDDTASLRVITTQVPALMNALEVMVEQTQKRCGGGGNRVTLGRVMGRLGGVCVVVGVGWGGIGMW